MDFLFVVDLHQRAFGYDRTNHHLPNCRSEIPLTESLGAPLLSTTRQQYERRLADKDREIAGREAFIRDQRAAFEQDRADFDARIAERLSVERVRIAGEEAAKAKQLAAADLDEKTKALADLGEVLRQSWQKRRRRRRM